MSILARCGSVALLLGMLAGTAALAQDAPKASGSWTDPPARGTAGPANKADGTKPGEAATPGPAAQVPASTPDKPVQKTATSTEPARFHRYAAPIKRLAARPRVIAAAPAVKATRSARESWSDRLRVATRQERDGRRARRAEAMTARRDESGVAARARRNLASAHIRRNYRDYAGTMPYAEPALPPVYARRAGWGGLVDDDRAYRIAQARAAGYRVMRLRTYAYPGGQAGELIPYDRGDLD